LKAEGLAGRQDVIRRRKRVLLRVRDEHGVVLLVVVGVVDEDVEHHAAKELLHVRDVRVAAVAAPAQSCAASG
jgi:hypothetical protein